MSADRPNGVPGEVWLICRSMKILEILLLVATSRPVSNLGKLGVPFLAIMMQPQSAGARLAIEW